MVSLAKLHWLEWSLWLPNSIPAIFRPPLVLQTAYSMWPVLSVRMRSFVTIGLVCSLVGHHKKVPKIAESVLLNLYAIRKRAQIQDISVSISKIRRAPEGKLAPRMFNRLGQQMGHFYGS
jgi:hypothetical protein